MRPRYLATSITPRLSDDDRREIVKAAAWTAATVAATELVQLGAKELRRWLKRRRRDAKETPPPTSGA